MIEIALSKGHEETDPLYLGEVPSKSLDLFVVKKIHILLANLREVVLSLYLHGLCLNPVSILPVAAVGAYFTKIDLRIKVCSKGIAVISAVAVKDIHCVYLIKIVFLGICNKYAGYTGIKACSKKACDSCFLELVHICPLIAVIKVSCKALLLASLLIRCTPNGLIGILRLVIGCVDVIDLALKASIHDSQILIRKRYIKYRIRLILLDQLNKVI